MRPLTIALVFTMATSIPVRAADLQQFKAGCSQQLQAIDAVYTAQLKQLKASHLQTLDKLRGVAIEEADLQKVKQIDTVTEQFREDGEVAREPHHHIELAALLATYFANCVALDTERATKIILTTSAHDRNLAKLERKLVSDKKLQEAESVNQARNHLKSQDSYRLAISAIRALSSKNAIADSPKLDRRLVEAARIERFKGIMRVLVMKSGTLAYGNSDLVWELPGGFPFSRFTLLNGDGKHGIECKVVEPGLAYVAIRSRSDETAHAFLRDRGWQKTMIRFAYSAGGGTEMDVYRKSVALGALKLPRLDLSGPILLLP